MRRVLKLAALVMITSIGLTLPAKSEQAQLGGLKRTDLLRDDLSLPDREVIQVLVEFAPGAAAPSHSHPGEEIAYVVEGVLEYTLKGQAPVTLKAGEALFIPSGIPHSAKNVGTSKAVELATYVVAKGKPLVMLGE